MCKRYKWDKDLVLKVLTKNYLLKYKHIVCVSIEFQQRVNLVVVSILSQMPFCDWVYVTTVYTLMVCAC